MQFRSRDTAKSASIHLSNYDFRQAHQSAVQLCSSYSCRYSATCGVDRRIKSAPYLLAEYEYSIFRNPCFGQRTPGLPGGPARRAAVMSPRNFAGKNRIAESGSLVNCHRTMHSLLTVETAISGPAQLTRQLGESALVTSPAFHDHQAFDRRTGAIARMTLRGCRAVHLQRCTCRIRSVMLTHADMAIARVRRW
jgi:hypothetical protein